MTDWASVTALSSFTTYFGTQINGSAITWYNDPDGTAGTDNKDQLKIEWVQKLQSNLKIWWNSADLTDPNSFTGDWALDDPAVTTETTDVFEAEATAGAVTSPKTGDASDIVWHMQFTNPVSSAVVTYDGFYAFAKAQVKWDGSAKPEYISYDWRDDPSDLAPTSDFDTTLDTAAVDADGNALSPLCTEDWASEPAPSTTSKLCTESWNLGNSGIACVELTGQFTRSLSTTADDTDDCDFDLDYISYSVKIQIG